MATEQSPNLNECRSMPEAEVTLRLALWLLDRSVKGTHADVAIDGAHIRIRAHEQAGKRIEERIVFDIRGFLSDNKCNPERLKDEWRGTYSYDRHGVTIKSGMGFDVRVRCDGKEIKAECKGGPLQPTREQVKVIFATAVLQVILCGSEGESEELWVAVPDSHVYEDVGRQILKSPIFSRTGIRIALVGKTGVRLLAA